MVDIITFFVLSGLSYLAFRAGINDMITKDLTYFYRGIFYYILGVCLGMAALIFLLKSCV